MNNAKTTGMSFTTVLFLIFLILKLTKTINWSWWWVTSPLWLPLVIGIAVLIVGAMLAFLFKMITGS